ncbi:FliM/FliN family flagellar motor switch protein [Chromobacterium subtsugae]|uniref:FliM/FliN family flagellar motor switch protein n=1 Tax=Chromobacterium subtsugae TaxID=251747 RepID=UPI000640D1AF|nr:FliM/FliN family flagellar motor switch protein [Chromobacterium subtsugae]
MPKAKIVAPQEGARLQALDLRTLGRPIHLLPLFARALQQELGDFLERELNRRYHAAFRITALRQNLPAADELRWQWHALGDWQLGSHFDRSLLLGILDYRFGASAAPIAEDLPAETETERRLARNLAERLLPRLAAAILQLEQAPGAYGDKPRPQPFAGQPAWQLEIELSDGDAPRGALRLRLGESAFETLLQNLSGQRRKLAGDRAPGSFRDRLTLRLDARLLQQELPLGAILDLKPGSVLPVTLPPQAEVCVRGAALFRAHVAERQGKLCLSGFADTE